jgi:hypothetical protein
MYLLALVSSATVGVTLVWFPDRYFDLVDRDEALLAAVAVRNGLLLLTLVLAAREIRRLVKASRAVARSTPPGRPAALRSAPH